MTTSLSNVRMVELNGPSYETSTRLANLARRP